MESSEISTSEWLSLNQLLYELKQINSACVSVYYPYGKGQDTISLLTKTKRKESFEKIETKIENRITELKKNPSSAGKFTKTLCIFGWIKNGKVNIKEIGTSKKLPYIYMVSKKPYIKPFRDILKTNYDILLVTLDQKSAVIQKFHGSHVVQKAKLSTDLRGRHKKGGQSQGRFLRARQTKIHVFFKKVANKVKKMDSNSEIILLGGRGNAKTEFFDELDSDLVKKCRFAEGLSFSTSQRDIHKKIIAHLYQHRKKHVAEIIEKYERLVKKGLTAKRNDAIYRALKMGAVDTLIVSAEYHTNSQFTKILKMLEIAKNTSCKIEFAVSQKIIEKLKIHDSVLAILRYRIK
ncbi:MAG: peptide chain release factor 1 [Nitrosopumilaceae archaeon]|nr:peptide chain release factor 1 [Nitrosopumilaceae archaeon]NIU01777.1 peptide chain release factor 1 [Nitrosopumilaceae archaeon]NIU88177.1 peptide chain release factor 1 [Nitrosopumilaceae archaeon]NIV66500.1 peptide chain release factor 1 [Nitrosopumilaceae archaeon]NIX62379.1 peptide chain release factor 1 [Nitrosopumilaceae archaeon]